MLVIITNDAVFLISSYFLQGTFMDELSMNYLNHKALIAIDGLLVKSPLKA